MPATPSGYVIIVDETVLDGSVEMFGSGVGVLAAPPTGAEASATTAEALPPEGHCQRKCTCWAVGS